MREAIYNLLVNQKNIYSAYFFGSFETDEFTDNSDIDIAFIGDLSLVEILKLEEILKDTLAHDVDLVNISDLPKYLQLQILVRNNIILLNNEEKLFDYLDTLNEWYKNDYPFWKKSMIERGHTFD